MSQKVNDDKSPTELKEKMHAAADVIIEILKKLYSEKVQVNSKLLSERMMQNESLKSLCTDKGDERARIEKEIVETALDRLSGLLPPFNKKIEKLKDQVHTKSALGDSSGWIDAAVEIVKKYIDSILDQSKELEDLLQKATKYISDFEGYMQNDITAKKGKFREDREFEQNIYSDMNKIEESFSSNNIGNVKAVVLSRFSNTKNSIATKRRQDTQWLTDAENAMQEMTNKIKELENELRRTQQKAQMFEFEAIHDKLTGLFNRGAYNQKIDETLANLSRYNVPASLIICDIDYFKKINDTFGHHVGDMILKKLAQLLKERLRKNDFVARYGGEEFAIILPHITLDNAETVGESVRSFIEKTRFLFKNTEIPVTISIGISSFRRDDTANTVFERADSALYFAKKSGRNMVKTEDDIKEDGINIKELFTVSDK